MRLPFFSLELFFLESFVYNRIYETLLAAQYPVLVSDVRLDGDSLGSVMAMYHFLRAHGKHPRVFVAEPVPEQYQFLPEVEVCSTDVSLFHEQVDVVAVFDCSEAAFVERLLTSLTKKPLVVNIDHHRTNPRYGQLNLVLEDAPATTDVLFRFFETTGSVIGKSTATCLLAGLCFDTNLFSNSATSARAFETASKLVLSGARAQEVLRVMYRNRSAQALKVWGAALTRLEEHVPRRVVTTVLTREDIETFQATDDEIDGLSNFLNLVTDTDTLMVLRETKEGGVKVSMRSRTEDVSVIAAHFGGGGHAKAAGFTLVQAKLVCSQEGGWCLRQNGHSTPVAQALQFEQFFLL